MKILFAASESVPYCKTGGLGDVAGALSQALKSRGHDVRLVLPKYRSIPAAGLKKTPRALAVPVAGRTETAALWEATRGAGVAAYFLEHAPSFDRPELYQGPDGRDYPDNDRRYILYARGVLELCKALDFAPDVVHCHDWQAGLIPAYLKTLYRADKVFARTASVMTIHNAAYQGLFPAATASAAGFPALEFVPDRLEYYGKINFLKAGLAYADKLSTVSPGYAREVQSSAEFGRGLEGLLRRRSADFTGILNGIDRDLWNPAADAHLAAPYSAKTLDKKAADKSDLQKKTGLKNAPSAPLLGVVSRLDPQKGFDILLQILEKFIADGVQAVFLGQGESAYRAALETLARKHPGGVFYSAKFDEGMAHKIYGGADVFLMPSRFEPCGLGQMIALRYGAVPVVTPTGGLKDTVAPLSPDKKSGVGFLSAAATPGDYAAALEKALRIFRREPAVWKAIQKRGMELDFSWDASAPLYEELYRSASSAAAVVR